MSRRFLIITAIFSFIALFVQWGFTSWIGLLSGIFDIILCSIVATLIIIALRRKGEYSFAFHAVRSALIFTSVLGFFSSFILLFVGYYTLFPASVGKIILSNGDRNIVFYQMSHIATPDFYTQINTDLISLTASGYTVYAEGVRPGKPESHEKFDALLGIKMTDTLYQNFAHIFGLTAQDHSLYAGISSGSLKNVDISLDELVDLISTGALLDRPSPLDMEKELSVLQTTGFGPLFGPFMRSLLSFMLTSGGDIDMMSVGLRPEVLDAILHDRNAHIVDSILDDSQKNIVLVYGALHFQGIYESLKKSDQKWNIVTIERMYPYSY